MSATILGYLMLVGGVSMVAASIARMWHSSQNWPSAGRDPFDKIPAGRR